MTAQVKYTGDLRTELKHLKSGQTIESDAPTDNNGKGERFSPTDMVAGALASCMLTVMGIKAKSLGIDNLLVGAFADVEKSMTSGPRRIAKLKVSIELSDKIETEHRKSIEATAKACPVANSLHPELEQEVTFTYL